jgi:hypothetical protein
LLINGVKIPSCIAQHFLQAALGNRYAGEVGDARDRFMEWVLHGRLDQSPLQFVAKSGSGRGGRCWVRPLYFIAEIP